MERRRLHRPRCVAACGRRVIRPSACMGSHRSANRSSGLRRRRPRLLLTVGRRAWAFRPCGRPTDHPSKSGWRSRRRRPGPWPSGGERERVGHAHSESSGRRLRPARPRTCHSHRHGTLTPVGRGRPAGEAQARHPPDHANRMSDRRTGRPRLYDATTGLNPLAGGHRERRKRRAQEHGHVVAVRRQPTRITMSSFGPWAPSTRIRSMSPVRLGPVMNESMLGSRPA